MKNMKKLLGIFLAVAMVLAMAIPTLATSEDTSNYVTVTVEDSSTLTGHTYKAYQIFKGTQADTGTALGDVEWGSGINSADFLSSLVAASISGLSNITVNSTAAEVATALATLTSSSDEANKVAKLAYNNKSGEGTEISTSTTSLQAGYYLIVDATTLESTADDALNAALLQVTGDTITIAKKTDKPTVEKKVKEDDATTDGGYGEGYNDVADYNIGDEIPYELIGSVPDMSQYDTYSYVFTDSMSKGLDLVSSSIAVYLSSDKKYDATDTAIDSSLYTIVTSAASGENGPSFTVTFNDLKTVSGIASGKYIIVTYKAKLNANAVIGLDGNPNEVYLTYSNNPNGTGTGQTPKDYNIVFTYELDTTKVDGDNTNTKLKDAEFVLKDSTGTKYAVINDTTKAITWTETKTAATTLTSNDDGFFSVIGLDDGTYRLEETKAPAGYNLLKDDIIVTIDATTGFTQDWSDGVASTVLTDLKVTTKVGDNGTETSGTGDKSTGKVAIIVVNNAGSTLPETGGIGTTIFYVLGGVLVLAAVVLLVTRKRVDSAR